MLRWRKKKVIIKAVIRWQNRPRSRAKCDGITIYVEGLDESKVGEYRVEASGS